MEKIKRYLVTNRSTIIAVVLYLVTCALFFSMDRRYGGAIKPTVYAAALPLVAIVFWMIGGAKPLAERPQSRPAFLAAAVFLIACTVYCLYRLWHNPFELFVYQFFGVQLALGGVVLYRKARPSFAARAFPAKVVAVVFASLIVTTSVFPFAANPCPLTSAEELLAAGGYDRIEYIAATNDRTDRTRAGDAWEPLGCYFFLAEKQGEAYVVSVSLRKGVVVESKPASG